LTSIANARLLLSNDAHAAWQRVTIFVERPGLLPRFRRGERAALEEIYFAYVDLVAFVVRQSAHGAHAADLIQETFARAFAERARLGYDGLRPYRPFLLTIARNLLVDDARKRGRELVVEDPPEPLPSEGAADPEWADADTVAVVERYVAGLDARLRALYEERYVKDRSQNEAAAALGLTRQKVRTLEEKLRRGLERALATRP
jgi:RNA polymerase sigma-70 factor, ECF subfamily